MKCPNCDREIDADSKFCEYCGDRLYSIPEFVPEDQVMWNVIKHASLDKRPLRALQARGKCIQYCKKEHPFDAEEYVDLFMKCHFPDVLMRIKLDRVYRRTINLCSYLCLLTLCVTALLIACVVLLLDANYYYYSVLFIFCVLACASQIHIMGIALVVILLKRVFSLPKWYGEQVLKIQKNELNTSDVLEIIDKDYKIGVYCKEQFIKTKKVLFLYDLIGVLLMMSINGIFIWFL